MENRQCNRGTLEVTIGAFLSDMSSHPTTRRQFLGISMFAGTGVLLAGRAIPQDAIRAGSEPTRPWPSALAQANAAEGYREYTTGR